MKKNLYNLNEDKNLKEVKFIFIVYLARTKPSEIVVEDVKK